MQPVIVVSGASGAGKSTLLNQLLAKHPGKYGFSVSRTRKLLALQFHHLTRTDTTRAPRPGETDGIDYYFVTPQKFQQLRGEGAFLENASFAKNSYGTSKAAVEQVQKLGKVCILDIEIEVCNF